MMVHIFAGVGRFQLLMLLYVGFAWMADAMEMMILSFLGPAVSPFSLTIPISAASPHLCFSMIVTRAISVVKPSTRPSVSHDSARPDPSSPFLNASGLLHAYLSNFEGLGG